ncbi:MAG: hypothetical protein A3D94_09640 [Alphaproteobacteria bacterium RIFCSPHIGHO2_12_FULL_66_14]|nr:MAG: hypothetical protein A3D94_09640 [Alphaproteobacteria bacterium RIFCSPHIGHO2_12_FULL_66_14]
MDGLHRRRNLGVRGREQAGDLLGQCLVGGKSCQLALPKVEISPGQLVEIGRQFVVFRGHVFTIAYRREPIVTERGIAGAKPFLSHCGIGANVATPT